MTANVYSVRRIEGLKQSSRRGVVFLECKQDVGIDAAVVFEKLTKNRERELRNRFEYWIDGFHHDRYFHGWQAPGYRECFVFKWKHKGKNHRFYAFLCHPESVELPISALRSGLSRHEERLEHRLKRVGWSEQTARESGCRLSNRE